MGNSLEWGKQSSFDYACWFWFGSWKFSSLLFELLLFIKENEHVEIISIEELESK